MRWASFKRTKEEKFARRYGRGFDREQWHRWYAWHPVRTIERQWVWLEEVERVWWLSQELTPDQYTLFAPSNWGYRLLQEEPKSLPKEQGNA